jgi:hypothetical protein
LVKRKPELSKPAAGDATAIVDAATAVRRLTGDGDAKTGRHVACALLTRVYHEETDRRGFWRAAR